MFGEMHYLTAYMWDQAHGKPYGLELPQGEAVYKWCLFTADSY